MTFSFWHSHHDEPAIEVAAIGLELRVSLPMTATGGALTLIETLNRPGFGPPKHRHRETEVFRVLSGRATGRNHERRRARSCRAE
jgi:mannose-6-phosphate isomerase-like protein (cupin superfamily)